MASAQRTDGAGQGTRLSSIWSQGAYERAAERFAPIHDDFVSVLAPRPHERLLDIGTGTGGIALRAARSGADVTGVDISAHMLEQARANAGRESLDVRFDEGDAQQLPYENASFDVVASCFGLVFAPDREAVARELARVTRVDGRIGLTAWRPRPEVQEIYGRFEGPPRTDHTDWGADGFVESLLGDAFELSVEERVWYLEAESAEDAYEFLAESAPPTRAFLQRLDPDRRDDFRDEMVAHFARFEGEDGGVREPRPYIVVLGRPRS